MSENNYIINNKKLMSEWDWNKNKELNPKNLTYGSHKKAWWKCAKGHGWIIEINYRTNGSGCPYCSNKKVLKGYNDLATTNPELLKDWDYNKNAISPNDITAGAEKLIWWICSKGHSYQSLVYNHKKGVGCPYCDNKKILKGYNDLSTLNPKLATEWNYEKNEKLKPTEVSANSHKKVWWKCNIGHEWEAVIKDRNTGNNCPFCSGKKVLIGYNDLATTNPKLAKEWNYEKNGNLKPINVNAGSQKKVWWKCNIGHEWQASIDSRSRGYECPYCKHSKVLSGYNDLLTTHPEIAKEWDYEKNKEKPDEVLAGSNIKQYWFICPKGHSYKTTLLDRKRGTNCPICSMERHTSFPEKSIYYYLKNHLECVKENYHNAIIGTKEIDIYLPKLKFGIEYDGRAWHKNTKRDLEKDIECSKNNITLLRVRENGCLDYKSDSIKTYVNAYNIVELNKAIQFIFDVINKKFNLNIKADIDIDRDRMKILEQITLSEKENSIAKFCPEIKVFWDNEKNGKITPEQISHGSEKKVFLKCPNGHEWSVIVSNFHTHPWCPYCSGRRVLTGFNDLFTTNPDLKHLWSNNNKIDPHTIKKGCNSKVLWFCPNCKGEYDMSVNDKTQGRGCPYCSNHRVLNGYNDLQTKFPEIAREWNFEKNENLTPSDVLAGSQKKVWWKCKICNYEWETSVWNRTGNLKRGCPKCSKENRISLSSKPVIQYSLDGNKIAEYKSAMEAERKTGIKQIHRVCRDERKSVGGYIWKYKKNG